MKLQLSDNLAELELEDTARLDAAGVDRLIADLAALRTRMGPAIPQDPPLACGDSSICSLVVRADAEHCILFRSPGLGWVGCALPLETILALRDFFSSVIELPSQGDIEFRYSETH